MLRLSKGLVSSIRGFACRSSKIGKMWRLTQFEAGLPGRQCYAWQFGPTNGCWVIVCSNDSAPFSGHVFGIVRTSGEWQA